MRKQLGLALVLTTGLVPTLGCGLADQLDKLRTVSFRLPQRSYSVSTMDPRWKHPPAGGIPQVPCGPGGVTPDCCSFPMGGMSVDCARSPMVCDAGSCALKFRYEQDSRVDLGGEVPALKSVGSSILSEVKLKEIELEIANSLNVALPPVDLFVAPENVTSPAMGGAHKIATIEGLTPGFRGQQKIQLTPEAQRAFSSFATDFKTPFNLLMATEMLYKGGPTPMGQVDLQMSGTVEAKF